MRASDKRKRQIRVSVPDEPPRLTPDAARILLRIVLAGSSRPGPEPKFQQEKNE
jgi:hypothetical protein